MYYVQNPCSQFQMLNYHLSKFPIFSLLIGHKEMNSHIFVWFQALLMKLVQSFSISSVEFIILQSFQNFRKLATKIITHTTLCDFGHADVSFSKSFFSISSVELLSLKISKFYSAHLPQRDLFTYLCVVLTIVIADVICSKPLLPISSVELLSLKISKFFSAN